jgi:hypothetical protein
MYLDERAVLGRGAVYEVVLALDGASLRSMGAIAHILRMAGRDI